MQPIHLIATIGISPSVLTEFIYQLYKNGDGPIVSIDILTTKEGVKKLKPLFDNNGAYFDLLNYLQINYMDIEVNGHKSAIIDKFDNELDDIRTREDDLHVAKAIYEIVQKRTADTESRVYALLSGGRKTMVSHLGSAMQVFGREDDNMYHVLVGDDYEKPGFYFPHQSQKTYEIKNFATGETKTVVASDAKIDLINIPFVRLRSFLEEKIDFSLPYEKLLAHIDQVLMTESRYPIKSLQISLFESCIYVNGLQNKISLEARELSVLALYALNNIIEETISEKSWQDIIESPMYLEILHVLYRQISIGKRVDNMAIGNRMMEYDEFTSKDTWFKMSYWQTDGKFEKKSFPTIRTRMLDNIREGLVSISNSVLNETHIFEFIKEKGTREALKTRQRCNVPVTNISFINYIPEEIVEILEDQDINVSLS